MAMTRTRRMLLRQWQIVRALSGVKRGLTVAQLMERTESARATVFRDLEDLREAGVPLASDGREGGRHRLLMAMELPETGLTALQVAALFLSRAELEPLAGTDLVAELDNLLERFRPPERQQVLRFARLPPGRPRVLKLIEGAFKSRRRLRMKYRAASRGGTTSVLNVEPLLVSVTRGEPYLRAYCVERDAERTYKLSRIAELELTDQRAAYRRSRTAADPYAHAVKIWSDEPSLVRVRLAPSVAWLANEYPLPAQRLIAEPDGGAVVEAHVAGLTETRRWVLGWGGAAEALHPPELREAIRSDLAVALRKYDGPGPSKARTEKSLTRGEDGLTKGEIRGV
jgi:predicted DNA-binding transcriptional regulator YafY